MNAAHRTRRRRRQAGFIGIIVGVGLFALAGTAAILSVVINSGNNQRTLDILSDPDATQAQLDTISDQDVRNLRNDLADNAGLLTGFSSLGTPTLPSGDSAAQVAANALDEQIRNVAEPAVVNYMSDPGSSWNRNGGADRPSEGTLPSGGLPPDEVPGGTGDVRITLVWSAEVDLDLHVLDPCGDEIYYASDSSLCNDSPGELDVDNTSGGPGSVENVFWPANGAPTGTYEYWVECFSGCDSQPANYTISQTVQGQRTSFSGTLVMTDEVSPHRTFTR
jgi:hypothetical protein